MCCQNKSKGNDKMELNIDQLRIVNSKPNGHTLIKGVAGSGKTTVAVSKIPNLINHYMGKDDEILFVTYNKTLIEYTRYLLKDMNIQQNIFFEFNIDKQLNIRTIDSIIYEYGKKIKPFFQIANKEQVREKMLYAISTVKKKYSSLEFISQKNYDFLNEEIDWLKSCRYIERETYLNVDRTGRMSIGKNKYRLHKNSEERNAIFDIYLCYEKLMEMSKLIDYKTKALKVLELLNSGVIVPKKYRHVIVDESQDLTRVQLEIIKSLYLGGDDNGSIMFIADAAQSIYTQSWLSGQSFKSIGFDMSGKSNILSKNYRTTYEIAQAAYSLIENDEMIKQNDIFVKPVAIDRHGDMPYYKHYENIEKEVEWIAEKIKKLSGQYALKDMVIAAANGKYLKHIKAILINKGVCAEIFQKEDMNFDEQSVRLYTLHSIKGLEFPVLFIAGINQGILPYSEEQISVGRRLLYVGMTRAKQELYLTSADKESVFIQEMDMKLFRSAETEFSPLYRVDISKYMFENKIVDKYSKEEAVRQWFINELITKLNYPKSNIDIEYPVQRFSERGYADVVVFHNDNGKRVPFILAEIKQPGADMDRAMKQLSSYAAGCPETEYIVSTDGQNTSMANIRNKKYFPVKCLPIYKEQECNLYEKYQYVDWKNKKRFRYEINSEDRNEIIIKDNDTADVIECGGYNNVNVIGKVAAGALKYANEEMLGKFSIPDVFARAVNDMFFLKVNGDSMIDFQINNGDYVLIKKQDYAVNNDIVVAGVRGENQVTLKKYINFGKQVGLIPGNPNYEPIMVMEENLFINGVLVGVLKVNS